MAETNTVDPYDAYVDVIDVLKRKCIGEAPVELADLEQLCPHISREELQTFLCQNMRSGNTYRITFAIPPLSNLDGCRLVAYWVSPSGGFGQYERANGVEIAPEDSPAQPICHEPPAFAAAANAYGQEHWHHRLG